MRFALTRERDDRPRHRRERRPISPMDPFVQPYGDESAALPLGPAPKLSRIAVVLNTHAGTIRREPESTLTQVRQYLESEGVEADVRLVPPTRVGSVLARIARHPDLDAVIVGGGDGTISSAVHYLAGSQTALGVLPLGTVNLLARDFDIPRRLETALDTLLHGERRQVDVGEVNGQRFAMHASIGVYPWIIRRRDRKPIRSRAGKVAAWLSVAPRALLSAPTISAELRHDTGIERIRSHLLMVAVGPTEAGIGPLIRRSTLDGGQLVAYYARRADRTALLKLALTAAVGPWPNSTEVDSVATRSLTVYCGHRRMPVALDGEVLSMTTPLRFRVLARALTVLIPDRGA